MFPFEGSSSAHMHHRILNESVFDIMTEASAYCTKQFVYSLIKLRQLSLEPYCQLCLAATLLKGKYTRRIMLPSGE
jgi:hypothetical protein